VRRERRPCETTYFGPAKHSEGVTQALSFIMQSPTEPRMGHSLIYPVPKSNVWAKRRRKKGSSAFEDWVVRVVAIGDACCKGAELHYLSKDVSWVGNP